MRHAAGVKLEPGLTADRCVEGRVSLPVLPTVDAVTAVVRTQYGSLERRQGRDLHVGQNGGQASAAAKAENRKVRPEQKCSFFEMALLYCKVRYFNKLNVIRTWMLLSKETSIVSIEPDP